MRATRPETRPAIQPLAVDDEGLGRGIRQMRPSEEAPEETEVGEEAAPASLAPPVDGPAGMPASATRLVGPPREAMQRTSLLVGMAVAVSPAEGTPTPDTLPQLTPVPLVVLG